MKYVLDPANVLLFWSILVEIENDLRGDTLLFPSTMPEGTTAGKPASRLSLPSPSGRWRRTRTARAKARR